MEQLLVIFLLACALVGGVMSLARPYLCFLAIVLMYALEQLGQSYFGYLQSHQQFVNYAIGLMSLTALAVRISRRERVTAGLANPVTILIAAQMLLWLVATMYSPAQQYALEVIQGSLPYAAMYLVLLPLLVRDIHDMQKVLVGLMVAGSVIAVLVIANPSSAYFSGRLVLDVGMNAQGRSAHGNPLALAELGGMMVLTAALIAPVQGKLIYTLLRFSAFMLGFGVAIGSGSRGQALATVVAGVLFYPLARRVSNPRNFILTTLGLIVLVVGVYVAFGTFIGDQNRERWDAVQMVKDITLRFDMCWDLLDAWLAKPHCWMFGLGANAYFDISGGSVERAAYVHNLAVEILCEYGIVGFAIFCATLVLTVRAGLRLWRRYAEDPMLRSVAAIIMAICAFGLFNALKQGSISSIQPFYWWLVLVKVSYFAEQSFAADDTTLDSYAADDGLVPQYAVSAVAVHRK